MNILNIIKRKSKELPYNIHHPDVADKIELAFECGPLLFKRKYYRFKAAEDATAEFEHRTGRYFWIEAFLRQSARKMDDKLIKQFLEDLKRNLSGERGVINLGNAFKIIHTMEAYTNLAFEPELAKRLASVVYFDESEDLRTYDRAHGEQKIKFWERYDKQLSFFLSSPIAELINVRGISVAALTKYIQEREEIIRDLTLATPTQSSDSL